MGPLERSDVYHGKVSRGKETVWRLDMGAVPRLFSAFSALSYGSIGSKRGLQSKWVRALVFLVYFFVCVFSC